MRNRFFSSLYSFLIALCCVFTASAALDVKDDYRSPRNKERPFRKSTRLILLHTTEAHAKSSLNKLSERGEAHYCVTDKGEVYRIIDRDREAFHAGRSMWNAKEDCDEYSVGIEVVGYHDRTMPLVQLAALKELVDSLKKIYNLRDVNVIAHSHVAYGAPNTWHKKKHRGRKRCGMLFAMPSVRAKLGLKARPGYDPDVKSGRLVQADTYLESILYGSVDTMASFYGKAKPQISASPAGKVVAAAPVKSADKTAGKSAAKPVVKPPPKLVAKPNPKPAVKPAPKLVARPGSKPAAKPAEKSSGKATVKPVVKPPLKPGVKPVVKPPVVPGSAKQADVPPPQPEKTAASESEETPIDWLAIAGLKGGYFKKKAKLVNKPKPREEQVSSPPANETAAEDKGGNAVAGTADADGRDNGEDKTGAGSDAGDEGGEGGTPLPLPKDLHIRKMGDDVKDLEALAKLPGYTRGGPVNAELSPYKIAGAAWRSPSTYYYGPRGKITTGDKVDEKSVEAGTFIFYKK